MGSRITKLFKIAENPDFQSHTQNELQEYGVASAPNCPFVIHPLKELGIKNVYGLILDDGKRCAIAIDEGKMKRYKAKGMPHRAAHLLQHEKGHRSLMGSGIGRVAPDAIKITGKSSILSTDLSTEFLKRSVQNTVQHIWIEGDPSISAAYDLFEGKPDAVQSFAVINGQGDISSAIPPGVLTSSRVNYDKLMDLLLGVTELLIQLNSFNEPRVKDYFIPHLVPMLSPLSNDLANTVVKKIDKLVLQVRGEYTLSNPPSVEYYLQSCSKVSTTLFGLARKVIKDHWSVNAPPKRQIVYKQDGSGMTITIEPLRKKAKAKPKPKTEL